MGGLQWALDQALISSQSCSFPCVSALGRQWGVVGSRRAQHWALGAALWHQSVCMDEL